MNAPTSLIPLVEANPVMVLVDSEKFDRFYEEVAREVKAHVPDLDTATGRKAIASLAYKVARTKTAIDDAGKKLTEDKRAEIKAVDEARRVIRERLDALKDEARKPLTEWEAAEEKRAADAAAILGNLKALAVITLDDTSEIVAARLKTAQGVPITEAQFAESFALASAAKANVIDTLTAGHARILKEEADRAELDRLRREAAEREEREAAARAEAERKDREEREAKSREEAAQHAKAAEEERVQAAAKAAEERARAEAERVAREAAQAQERAHAEALAAEKRRADAAEAAAREEAARVAREAADQAKREANRAHRGKVMLAAKTAIMGHGVGEATAKAIVLAIAANEVPNVSISF